MIPKQPNDHVAWLAYWADETVRAIEQAIVRPPQMVTQKWDLDLEQAVRCARAAAGRALRLSSRQIARLL